GIDLAPIIWASYRCSAVCAGVAGRAAQPFACEGQQMKHFLLRFLPFAILVLAIIGPTSPTAGQSADDDKKYEDFDKLTKGGKSYDGLFKLHQKDDNLYAEIRPEQLEKPFLCPIAIARGLGMGGHTLNFDEQWVLVFKRVNDRI